MTGGNGIHMMVLSKAMSQMTPGLLMGADPMLKTLLTDSFKGAASFGLNRTSNGYSLDIEYTIPVKAKSMGGDTQLCDPHSSRVTLKATIDIPFAAIAAIDGQGNIDWSQIGLDPQKPPRYDLTLHPI